MNGLALKTTVAVAGSLALLLSAGTASAAATVACPAAPDGARLVDTVQGGLAGSTGDAAACGISWTTPTGSGTSLCATIVTNEVDENGNPVKRETTGCVDGATVDVDPQLKSGHLAGQIPDGAIAVDLTVTPGSPAPGVDTSGGLSAGLLGSGATGGSISAPTFGTDATAGNGTVERRADVPASASPMIVAGPAAYLTGFAPPKIVIFQGGSLEFLTADASLQQHNVYSRKLGPDYRPIFKSETVTPPSLPVPVEGVERLAPGDYDFYCTMHGSMTGTLTVLAPPAGRLRHVR
jgi:plastocyanin